MDTRRTTVSQAFPPRIQYVVPSYQRNYVWTKEGQWEPLWDDVLEVVRRLLGGESKTEPHFLGTIITKPMASAQSRLERWSVVDGQQRLTTLQVLIAAARSIFSGYEELEDHAQLLSDYLFNQSASVIEPEDRYKIRHKSSDYRGFSSVVEVGLGNGLLTHGAHGQSLQDCYLYFRNQVEVWLASEDSKDVPVRADALCKAIMDGLQVVDISLDKENSHAIFEALNARGEPLSEWEKTKNYILSLAVREDDEDGDRTYTRYLEDYDADVYWNQWVKATRFAGKRIDLFLFFFAQIELPERRREILDEAGISWMPQKERLYRDFRYVGEQLYRQSDDQLHALLERLRHYAEIYRQIDNIDESAFSEYTRLVMQRRKTLNLATMIPVFMVLVDRLGYDHELDQALRIVDSYLMRRVALRATYSGFDEVAFGYVQAVRDAPEGEVCAALINQLEGAPTASRWPDNDEVLLHLREHDMYNGISSARKQLLLKGIGQAMYEERETDLSMPLGFKTNLTVEHVAPQNWERHWKTDLGFGDSEEESQRLNGLVHRIGNLTIVSSALNHKLGDKPWEYKERLLRDDNLEMNLRLLGDMQGETWNEKEIHRRSQIIADYVNRIWPDAATLRSEMGITPPKADEESVFGISSDLAKRLIDDVTESGIEDGWADTEGLYRSERDGRYGRDVYLGDGEHRHRAWFGVGSNNGQLVLDYWNPGDVPSHVIELSDGLGSDELIEFVTLQVQQIAEALADGDSQS